MAIDSGAASSQVKHRFLHVQDIHVAKPELGTKRLCAGCGAKFYDLNKDPILCPKCGTVFEVAPAARTRNEARSNTTDDNAPETTDAEFVSLEEADAEKKTGKVNTAIDVDDDIDIDEDLGDDDESTFIPDEEEGDDDVTNIIGDVDSDDDT